MKSLHRSSKKRIIFGVCGGIGEYFQLDANIVRLLAVFLFFIFKLPIVLFYFVAMIIMPPDQDSDLNSESETEKTASEVKTGKKRKGDSKINLSKGRVKLAKTENNENVCAHTDEEFESFFQDK